MNNLSDKTLSQSLDALNKFANGDNSELTIMRISQKGSGTLEVLNKPEHK